MTDLPPADLPRPAKKHGIDRLATSVKLTPQITRQLKQEAKKQQRSVSSLLRIIIAAYLDFRRVGKKTEEK